MAHLSDESLLVEGIFPALKDHVRKNKRPGQFILSGSVRFSSKKIIRESLTGRIQYLELLPMTIGEIEGEPLSSKLALLMKTDHLPGVLDALSISPATARRKQKWMDQYLVQGGLPGICFIRKESLRISKILDQLRTLLDRDLRQIHQTPLSFCHF